METKTILAVFGAVCSFIVFICGCVSASLPSWWSFKTVDTGVSIGLFTSCFTISGVYDCVETKTNDVYLVSMRWVFLFGLIVTVFVVLFGFTGICVRNPYLYITIVVLAFIAAACSLTSICLCAYLSHANYNETVYGMAFFFAIGCLVLMFVSSILFILAMPKFSSKNNRVINVQSYPTTE